MSDRTESSGVVRAHFAPMCRGGRHMPKQHRHNYAALTGKACACPCHLGNEGLPWWSDLHPPVEDQA